MLVKVAPGRTIFREGHIRTEASGVFRLMTPPPSNPDEPHDPELPDGPTRLEKWLGTALEIPDAREVRKFEDDDTKDVDFRETLTSTDFEATMGRAGAIVNALHKLDHTNDAHWLADGRPNAVAVEELSRIPKVQQYEIQAASPEYRRTPAEHRGAPRKRFTDKG